MKLESQDLTEPSSQPEIWSSKENGRVSSNNLGPDNHLSILNRPIQDVNLPPHFLEIIRRRNCEETFVEDSRAETIAGHILKRLDPDLLALIETGKLRLDTLKKLEKTKTCTRHIPGIYVHVLYKPTNPDVIGIYIGSSLPLFERVKEHRRDRRRPLKKRRTQRTMEHGPALKPKPISVNQEAWNKEGTQDFWLSFAQPDLPNSEGKRKDLVLLLNVLESIRHFFFALYPEYLCNMIHLLVLRLILIHGLVSTLVTL